MDKKKYYTYRYAYPQGFIDDAGNDLSGVVFYVGKGSGKRINDHEAEARRGCPCYKCRSIRSVWAEDMQVDKAKMLETYIEEEAFAHEYESILEHSSVYLTNVVHSPLARLRPTPLWKLIEAEKDEELPEEDGYATKYDMLLDAHNQGKIKSDFDSMWGIYLDYVDGNGETMGEYIDQFLGTLPPDLMPDENKVMIFKEITFIFWPENEAPTKSDEYSWY